MASATEDGAEGAEFDPGPTATTVVEDDVAETPSD